MKRIVLTEKQKKEIEDCATGLLSYKSNRNLRCPSCNRPFSIKTANMNGHTGYCRRLCLERGPGWTIRAREAGLSPNERRIERIKRRNRASNYKKESKGFLASTEWRILRYEAFRKYGNSCQCCGAKPPNVILHVDHIKPRYTYPDLALEINNLQILCEACNLGKGARHDDDFR